jgi:hypothetical protein
VREHDPGSAVMVILVAVFPVLLAMAAIRLEDAAREEEREKHEDREHALVHIVCSPPKSRGRAALPIAPIDDRPDGAARAPRICTALTFEAMTLAGSENTYSPGGWVTGAGPSTRRFAPRSG